MRQPTNPIQKIKEKNKINLLVLTGSGISKESGIPTFRDEDGLWNKFDVKKVCTPEALENNTEEFLEFYNSLYHQIENSEPNNAHKFLKELENDFDVYIMTTNVDNLHEKAGSSNILHLHGKINEIRSSKNPYSVSIREKDLKIGDRHEDGSQLRPNIVLFGEYLTERSYNSLLNEADIFLIIGSSLKVNPVCWFVNCVNREIPVIIVDPNPANLTDIPNLIKITGKASEAIPELEKKLNKIRSVWKK